MENFTSAKKKEASITCVSPPLTTVLLVVVKCFVPDGEMDKNPKPSQIERELESCCDDNKNHTNYIACTDCITFSILQSSIKFCCFFNRRALF